VENNKDNKKTLKILEKEERIKKAEEKENHGKDKKIPYKEKQRRKKISKGNTGKTHNKINKEVFVKEIVNGKAQWLAYRLAGGVDCKKKTAEVRGCKLIKENRAIKKSILEQLAEKQQQVLDNLTDAKAKKTSYSQLAVSFGVLTDKKQLLEGKATNIVEGDLKIKKAEDAEKYIAKAQGK